MAHELAMRDKDAAIMAQELGGRVQVAQVEAPPRWRGSLFDALAKSYDFAKPAAGGKMEAFSAFVRPFISLAYFIVTSIGSAVCNPGANSGKIMDYSAVLARPKPLIYRNGQLIRQACQN
jgi:hypothetical protein